MMKKQCLFTASPCLEMISDPIVIMVHYVNFTGILHYDYIYQLLALRDCMYLLQHFSGKGWLWSLDLSNANGLFWSNNSRHYAIGWMTWGLIPRRDKKLFLPQVVWTGSRAHPAIYSTGVTGSFFMSKVILGVKVTTHLHLVLMLRMSETNCCSSVLSWHAEGYHYYTSISGSNRLCHI
jgi:hypothetical protein